jgi:hypothetical protein
MLGEITTNGILVNACEYVFMTSIDLAYGQTFNN